MTQEKLIADGMIRLAENFGSKITEGKVMLWMDKFQKWPPQKFKFAVEKIIEQRTSSSFPVIAEVIKASESWASQ